MAVELQLGLVAALAEELGSLRERASRTRVVSGLELFEVELEGARVLAATSGIGKVAAARAATVLAGVGATDGLLVVGTCGGLRKHLAPGTLVHCSTAVQTDLAGARGAEVESDRRLREARQAAAGGWF
jgi:adenosylhomocysteine nucleosidase